MSGKKGGLVVFGAIFGFILGMFLAPKKGSELRKDAKEKFDDIKENPEEAVKNSLESMKNKINSFSDNFLDEDDLEAMDLDDENIVISRVFKEVEDNAEDDIVLNIDKEEGDIK